MLTKWLSSKTIIAAVLTLIANGLSLAGLDVGTDSLQKAVDAVIILVQVLGPIGAVIGRVVAKPSPTPTLPLP